MFPLIISINTKIETNDYQKCSNLNNYPQISSLDAKLQNKSYQYYKKPGPINGDLFTLSVLGWWTCPPSLFFLEEKKKKKKRQARQFLSIWAWFHFEAALNHLTKSYLQPTIRTLFLLNLWLWSGQWLPAWLLALPIAEWLLTGICLAWPWLAKQAEIKGIHWLFSTTRLIIFWLLATRLVWLLLYQFSSLRYFGDYLPSEIVPVAGFVLSRHTSPAKSETKDSADSPQIWIEKLDPSDEYEIHLKGNFHFTLQSSDPFLIRMAIIFLRLLTSQEARFQGRATRDGRRPIVSQTALAKAFSITQPEISRWEKYWLDKDWPNLLSLKSSQILTVELRQQIVEVFARRPWWGVERVYQYLDQQGIKVTKSQIRQAVTESGWQHLRKTLNEFFVVSEENIRPRDEALLKQLLNQNQILLDKLENSQQLTPQEQLDINSRKNAALELGIMAQPTEVSFVGQKIRNVLFSDNSSDSSKKAICCTSCGSDKVRKKGLKGYERRYFDENRDSKTCQATPYYCENPDCEKKTFTHLPEGLLPHSPYLLQVHLQAVYFIAVLGVSYRRTAVAEGSQIESCL